MEVGFITPVRYNEPSGGNVRAIQFSNKLSELHNVVHFNIDTRYPWPERPTDGLTDGITEIDTAIRSSLLPLPMCIIMTIIYSCLCICRKNLDVIYVEGSFWHPPIIGWICSQILNIPLVISVDDYAEEKIVKASFLRLIINGPIRKFVLENSENVILETRLLEADLKTTEISPKRTTVVPTGIDLEDFYDKYPGEGAESNSPTVYYVGRSGDIQLLLESAKIVRQRISNVEFRIVGVNQEEYPSYDEPYISFLGRIYNKRRVYEEMARSHICVVPYTTPKTAGRPVKLLEYMAGGKCIVATDFPYNTQMITDGENGIITPADVASFAGGIITAINDQELRNRLASQAKNDVDDYALEKTGEKFENVLQSTV